MNKKSILTYLSTGMFLLFFSVGYSMQQHEPTGEYNHPDTSLAALFKSKGMSFTSSGNYDSSYYYLNRAIEIYKEAGEKFNSENGWGGMVDCLNELSWDYTLRGKYDTALVMLDQSLSTALQKLSSEHPSIAKCYTITAIVWNYKGDLKKALDYQHDALKFNLKTLGEKNIQTSGSYNTLGVIFADHMYFDTSFYYYRKSIEIAASLEGDYSAALAKYYNNLGNAYRAKGNTEKSLESLETALELRIKVFGPDDIAVATTYDNLALIYGQSGDDEKAVDYMQKALTIFTSRSLVNHPLPASTLYNLGYLYSLKGDDSLALHYYQKSLHIRLNLWGEDNPKIAQSYNSMGRLYASMADYDKAVEFVKKSEAIRRKFLGEHHPLVFYDLKTLGDIYYEQDMFDEALLKYNEALNLVHKLKGAHRTEILPLYTSIALIRLRQGNFTDALAYCEETIKGFLPEFNADDPEMFNDLLSADPDLIYAFLLRGNILAETPGQENLNKALTSFEIATDLIGKTRSGYKSESSKILISEKFSEVYEKGIVASLKLFELTGDDAYKNYAFLFAERSKAAVLKEQLLNVRAKEFSGIPVDLKDKEKQLRTDLAFYETAIVKEQVREPQDTIKINNYRNILFDLKEKYFILISTLEKDYPAYYDLKYQTTSVPVNKVMEMLDQKSALVEYFLGDSSIYIFLFTEDIFEIVTVNKPADFNRLVLELSKAIQKSDRTKYIRSANQLSGLLITPVLRYLNQGEISNLVIIPHDILYKLPFETLFTEEQDMNNKDYSRLHYLVKDYSIKYHYSASLYRNKTNSRKKFSAGGNNFIGFAPVFSEDLSDASVNPPKGITVSLDRSSGSESNKFTELKFSAWEVQSILNMFGTESLSNRGYFYTEATENAFKENAGSYRFIHIASHSFINEVHPRLSGIAFAGGGDDQEISNADGILYAGETYSLNLNADLIVLSSCESGVGILTKGEGMMALTRGFLYTGSRNIVFSLWKVPDKPTSELMIEFYRSILEGNSYSAALREARLKLISKDVTARPRVWASFILVGTD